MEKVKVIASSYFRADRSIDTLIINEEVYYVYNYEGWHFRLFNEVVEVIAFFNGEKSHFVEFETEEELDNYIENIIHGKQILVRRPL